MAHDGEEEADLPRGGRRRVGCWILLALLAAILLAFGLAWLNREQIADNVIASVLDDYGVAARYEIESIGPERQVLRNIVVGDPARPDLTIERAEVTIEPRFGFPAIGRVSLSKPRLYGRLADGQLSFGALDSLIFTGGDKPFEFPDMNLAVTDGRALLQTDYGPVGIMLEGEGHLRGGFAGELAATAPRLAMAGCEASAATLYGRIGVEAERPRFDGPLRFATLACPDADVRLDRGAVQLGLVGDRTLKGFDGDAGIELGAARQGGNRIGRTTGEAQLTWRSGDITARYQFAAGGIATTQAAIGNLSLDGSLRTRRGFANVELDGMISGRGVRPGPGFDAALADLSRMGEGTLVAPVGRRISSQLTAEGRDSRLSVDWTLRRLDGRTSFVMPNARLLGSSGATLLSLSRVQIGLDGADRGVPRFSGNFATGGEGLPRLAGRMEEEQDGGLILRVTMAPYSAGDSRLAVPELLVRRDEAGALDFRGEVQASGALPGGRAEGLTLPVSGSWSPQAGLALWQRCTDLRFDRLEVADLSLDGRRLRLCPPRGRAILRYGASGLQIAAGAPSLDLTGTLAGTPLAIRSGPVGFGWPGAVSARQLQVTLGPPDSATSFAISDLGARIGDEIAGSFTGADIKLFSVPLDLLGASGDWRYADGRLVLTNGSFRLEDRAASDRFEPLMARDATLTLANSRITARALLREPASDRAVTRVDIAHNLSTATGHADLAVEGLQFDSKLQPEQLSKLAYGVVANVKGTVTGTGRIDWNAERVTSSGRFSSDSLDLAAVFGPVRGASGTIVFTDLLGLTTAAHQTIHVAAINPGTEVYDGDVVFTLTGGELLQVEGGKWPFFGGTLTMQPVPIRFGAAEERRYTFDIQGLDAALFIQRMELENISATGVFDGTVPIVFDRDGNGSIEDGRLVARAPGGNLSYVGELTYKDLSPMADFAFAALRSLDYEGLEVEMGGPLTGEIVTSLRFQGISQGQGAQKNFITRRVAGLPFRFVINIRAAFYTLLGDLRSIYDPANIRDPREIGLLDAEGNPIERPPGEAPPNVPPPGLPAAALPPAPPNEPTIQPSESE
ncbi:conserved hypothetical protein [Altererythrobacter sp. B11]|uniref:intermembrane phospholipid transport protein YdbH family protein n=1 Tax=Altererythrobacter sp. B11 TaxID=2060312 RepID=UPI000DC6E574|nr:YdbH domain-containing protein [Altererythrobacter sp. B11]BBC72407.1 conserved hypothetical protein [Altererythrobacter sp. B11]